MDFPFEIFPEDLFDRLTKPGCSVSTFHRSGTDIARVTWRIRGSQTSRYDLSATFETRDGMHWRSAFEVRMPDNVRRPVRITSGTGATVEPLRPHFLTLLERLTGRTRMAMRPHAVDPLTRSRIPERLAVPPEIFEARFREALFTPRGIDTLHLVTDRFLAVAWRGVAEEKQPLRVFATPTLLDLDLAPAETLPTQSGEVEASTFFAPGDPQGLKVRCFELGELPYLLLNRIRRRFSEEATLSVWSPSDRYRRSERKLQAFDEIADPLVGNPLGGATDGAGRAPQDPALGRFDAEFDRLLGTVLTREGEPA